MIITLAYFDCVWGFEKLGVEKNGGGGAGGGKEGGNELVLRTSSVVLRLA